MGIIRQGILGGFRQKTGSVVGAHHRGQDIIRALPRKSNKPATQAQANQRSKFGMVTSFLSRLVRLINIGFDKGQNTPTPMNKAVAYHLSNAITGVAPDFTIDYTKVRFSRGNLVLPENITVTGAGPAQVKFGWTPSTMDDEYQSAGDMANVLLYNPVKDRFVMLINAAARSVGTYTLQAPPDFIGDSVHCYVSFTSVTKKQLCSDSQYVEFVELA